MIFLVSCFEVSLDFDVIIVGVGIIGCVIVFNFLWCGVWMFNIDVLLVVGYGLMLSFVVVVRIYYLMLDGLVFVYEGYYDWKNWFEYLG